MQFGWVERHSFKWLRRKRPNLKGIKLFPSNQGQPSSKNISSEDHYIGHSAPKRRKNEFGYPQSVNLTKLPSPSDTARSDRNKMGPSYYSDRRLGHTPDLGLELDMENIKNISIKEPALLIIADRERKFSDSSGSSTSTSVATSPKVTCHGSFPRSACDFVKFPYLMIFTAYMFNKCHYSPAVS